MKTIKSLRGDMDSAKKAYDISKKVYHVHNRDMMGHHWTCFWTRPLGHVWEHPDFSSSMGRCIFCNKETNFCNDYR